MAHEDLFPPGFVKSIQDRLPEAESNLRLAERRLEIAKAVGGKTEDAERRLFTIRERLRKIKAVFGSKT